MIMMMIIIANHHTECFPLYTQVFDYDRYSRNDVVGEVSMRLDEFNVTTNTEVWAEVVKNKKVRTHTYK